MWNGLTNEYHPTQMLADLLTIKEHLGRLEGVKLVYMGDARYNMGNSLMIACAKMGMHFTACTAKEYFPNQALVEQCEQYASESGGSITLTEDTMTEQKMLMLFIRMSGCLWVSGRSLERAYLGVVTISGKRKGYAECRRTGAIYALSSSFP